MSADAASLPCPICSHIGIFDSVQSLRDRLICVSTNNIPCPVCQEEVTGLDKLTIHLFSHVKFLNTKCILKNDLNADTKCKSKPDNQNVVSTQQKKLKASGSKNKTTSSTTTAPVKYVKIYPKLPVISVNTVSVISQGSSNECTQKNNPLNAPMVKTEPLLKQTSTTCNVCGLQFVDDNILKMHKCIIHNINDNSNQNFIRYQCHLCPKNFKMRGSLMVHLRVAHFGFSSHNSKTDDDRVKTEDKNTEGRLDNKTVNFERNDNKQWQCDVCQKCFTTKYFLKKHKRLHTGETPYACTQCNKTFTFQQSYHKHLLYHNDEKPHTCSYCGRAFKELSTLHNHQRIHTGEKPFSCETCGKCFRQRVSYLVHRRIHTGVMPYKCTACNKSFRYKVSQRTHKCQAQPPGTVVRQTGDLIEKLIKKHANSMQTTNVAQQLDENVNYPEISEANAELVRSGAKLSLEDTETENFTLIEEAFNNKEQSQSNNLCNNDANGGTAESNLHIFNPNIDELIESLPIVDKSLPSPSEILQNLSLTKEDDYIAIRQDNEELSNYDMYKDLFL